MKRILYVILSLVLLLSHFRVNAEDRFSIEDLWVGQNSTEEFIENFTEKNNGHKFLDNKINHAYEINHYSIDFVKYFDFMNRDNLSRMMINTDAKGYVKQIFVSFNLTDYQITKAKNKYLVAKVYAKIERGTLMVFRLMNRGHKICLEILVEPYKNQF